MVITIEQYVPQGRSAIRGIDTVLTSIGTDGASVCVAIIVVYLSGRVFCGHLDSAISQAGLTPQEYENKVKQSAASIFQKRIGPAASVKELVHTTNGDKSTRWIVEVINQQYPDKANPKPGINGLYCISSAEGYQIKEIQASEHIKAIDIVGEEGFTLT